MAFLTLKGRVEPDGRVVIDEKVNLPPGEITLLVRSRVQIQTVTLEAAKRELAKLSELSEEDWADPARIHELLSGLAADSEQPTENADDDDRYLFGVPKDSELDDK